MGHTHYFNLKKNIPARDWAEIRSACARILAAAAAAGVSICGPHGTGAPEITADLIAFNGDDSRKITEGRGEWAYETTEACDSFWLSRQRERDRDGKLDGGGFCKTNERPYDIACTATGCYLESCWPEYFTFSSDGRTEDWEAGLALARTALPEKGNQLCIPAQVVYDSQWQAHLEHGKKYVLKQHKDGSYRICRRGQMDDGVIIDMAAAQAHAASIAKQFSGWHYSSDREKAADRVLAAAIARVECEAQDPSRQVGALFATFGKIARDHLATAGGAS